ncbi:MAG: hypothetical protein AB202_02335 [Parcubacteria bacterium C7867-007]|nr:MAG: hypothetical protein AB202_02335 [Parcubacteria bacterium C7867-007]
MPIFRALGLGILILILQLLVPTIFLQLQSTIIAFLNAAEISATVGSQLAGSAGSISGTIPGSSDPLTLPRATNIIR